MNERPAPTYTVEVDQRMTMVISTVSYLGISVHLLLIPFFAWIGAPWLAALNVGSSAAWIAGWTADRRGDHPTAVTLMTLEVVTHTVITVTVLGWQAGFQYYLLGGIPFTLFNTRWRTRQIVVLAALMSILFSGLYLTTPSVRFVFPSPWLAQGLHVTNAIVSFAAIGLASYYFRVASLSAEEELEVRATTDPLTAVHNRRRMLELLDQEQARAARSERPFALVIADVDRFKAFNDNHGHECGDEVLRAVTSVLSGRLRRTDQIGRWGGEEFVVLLPDSDAEGATGIAETLRRAVEEHRVSFDGQELAVTMTFGVSLGDGDDPVDAVLARADAALYRGKAQGRNCVRFEAKEGVRP